MAKMTERIKGLFEKVENVILATATKEGVPNAVPIGAKKIIDDETILISDQFLNKTLNNMKDNPQVFWRMCYTNLMHELVNRWHKSSIQI